ncbi:unnamed protein product, partial [Owenia fusiformis]
MVQIVKSIYSQVVLLSYLIWGISASIDKSPPKQDNYDVKLAGDFVDKAKGRVEIYYRHLGRKVPWARICNKGWTIENARVVCRHLGYDASKTEIPIYASESIEDRTNSKEWGQGKRDYGIANFNCTGNE